MEKLISSLLFLLLMPLGLKAQTSGDFYVIDTQHSMLDFKTKHIGFSSVRGKFKNYEGTIFFNPNDISATSASLTIEVASIESGAGGRDAMLKQHFFQVEKHPFITFSSKSVVGSDPFYLKGDLTMGDVTREVDIPFELISGPAEDQWKHQRITIAGELTIDRKDFGIYYRDNEFWDNVVANKVTIAFEVGARVYNSLETVFPFRENAIGRLAFEAYNSGGKEAMLAKLAEVLNTEQTEPNKFITSNGQILRGGTHLLQAVGPEAAEDYASFMLEQNIQQLIDEMKAELLARKAQYLLLSGKKDAARKSAEAALLLYKSTLAIEVLKKLE